ncbi:MAG: TonB-dependent receptor [Bacteroidetes bacterium]|nr:TonB-dependent receptor [Bacteroidota bacterium]
MTKKIHELDEVVVKKSRLKEFAIGSSVQVIDSLSKELFSNFSMAELLANLSLVTVNQNGPGGASNPAIRGGSSAQTAVIWNGINIQNPSNGSVNLAQLPTVFFDNISIQYGGSGTLFGSGAASGAIHIDSRELLSDKNNIGLQASLGSFNTKNTFVGAKLGNGKWANSFKYYFAKADNDFEYKLTDGVKVRQTNAGLIQHAVLTETKFKTSDNSSLKATIWFQKYDKDIQTTISAADASVAYQEDEHLNLALNWEKATSILNVKAKSVFLSNELYYNNPALMLENTNKSRMWVSEVDAKFLINHNNSITAGINYIYEEGESENFASLSTRRRAAVFVSHKVTDLAGVFTIVSSLRQELVDSNFNPIVPSLGLRASISQAIAFNGNVSRVYRNPTFNDLFWYDPIYNMMGNPGLNPENGWSLDAGLEQTFNSDKVSLVFKQNFFLNHIKDWIAWMPNADYSAWNVENKNKGKTIGLDLVAQSEIRHGETIFSAGVSYIWTQSNFIDVVGEVENGSKMLYVPQHRMLLNLSIQQKNWNILYSHNYFDSRYTGSYSENLGAYFVGNLSVQYMFPFGKQHLTAALHVNNIWNGDYQVIYDYAMPGRSVKLSLYYNLNL